MLLPTNRPPTRYPVLVVHANAVAALLVAFERLEAVRWRICQERQVGRGVHPIELAGDRPDLARNAPLSGCAATSAAAHPAAESCPMNSVF